MLYLSGRCLPAWRKLVRTDASGTKHRDGRAVGVVGRLTSQPVDWLGVFLAHLVNFRKLDRATLRILVVTVFRHGDGDRRKIASSVREFHAVSHNALSLVSP